MLAFDNHPASLRSASTGVFPSPLPAELVEVWVRPCFDVQTDFLDPLSFDEIDSLDGILAADCVLHFPGLRPVVGAAFVKRVLRSVRRRYTVLRFEAMLQIPAPRDFLIVNSNVRGLRKDGIPYANEVISLIRLDPLGRVAMISDFFKSTKFLQDA